MKTTGEKTILAVLNDLMFTAKIQDAAKRAGAGVIFAAAEKDVMEKARIGPALILLDLNTTALDALQTIHSLKQDQTTRGIPLVGFVSHVQIELRQAAQIAGCNEVIARSVFSLNLPAILKRYVEDQV